MAGAAGERETFYVVQGFTGSGRESRMDAPVQASSEPKALALAERLAERKASVLVLAVTGDRLTGEFDDPEVLAAYGVPVGDDSDGVSDLPF